MISLRKRTVIREIKKNELLDFSFLLLGAALTALAFNLFLLPNDILVGFSGLSIIANNLWGIKPSLFIAIGYAIIVVLSYIYLGKSATKKNIIGSLLYPFFVEVTSYLTPYVDLTGLEAVVLVLCGAVLSGFGSGLVYKVGYSTGGSDVVNQLVSKYIKRPIGTSMLITDGCIIGLGFFVFGFKTVIYSVIAVYVISFITDKVMIGISQSKSFYVITDHETEVKKFLLRALSHGVTVIPARGGYTGNEIKMIMCIVPTKEYVTIKENILAIDERALILVSDTYEVLGSK